MTDKRFHHYTFNYTIYLISESYQRQLNYLKSGIIKKMKGKVDKKILRLSKIL